MVDRPVDVLGSVLEGDSKPVETMSLDVDVDVLVLVAAGNSGDKCWCDRLGFTVCRERKCDRLGIVFIRALLTDFLY